MCLQFHVGNERSRAGQIAARFPFTPPRPASPRRPARPAPPAPPRRALPCCVLPLVSGFWNRQIKFQPWDRGSLCDNVISLHTSTLKKITLLNISVGANALNHRKPDHGIMVHGVPGHALHEKGLQRQKGDGPLVSSQEHRALLVPRLNRLSTGCRSVVNRSFGSSIVLHRISLVRASGETFRRRFFDALEGTRDACLLGELFCRRPALPGPTPLPRLAPRPDPPVVCPGFGLDRFPW